MDDMIKERTSKRDQHIFHTKKPCQCYQPEFPLSKPNGNNMIADIYISISMETFEHREYKSRGEDGNK